MSDSRVRNLLHEGLVLTWRLGRLPWPFTPLLIALAALALGLAGGSVPAVLWLAACSAADWLLLAALPRLGLSYGTVQPVHLALLTVRWPLAWLAAAFPPALALQPLLWALAAYAVAVEPFRLQVTRLTLRNARAAPGARPLSIVHITDLHVERLTRREQQLLATVERLQPDLILLTGDYLNLSYVGEETAIRELRAWLGGLRARHGIYAVRGTPQVDPPWIMPHLFEGLGITVLEGACRELEIDGHRLRLAGVGCDADLAADGAALQRVLDGAVDGAYTILLYHMPDLFDRAAELGVELLLAGHTHGGQLCLPLYGAIITASRFGKRFEQGWYRQGRTQLYVARGVGLEGMGAPRARFLCPPEVVHITLG